MLRSIVTLVMFLGAMAISSKVAASAVVEGTVRDFESGDSLPFVTVQLLGTGKCTAANEDGRFRMVCDSGLQILKFSHIGYYSVWDTLMVGVGLAPREIRMLRTIVLAPAQVVYDRQFDPAQRIIIEAIKRKKEILERLSSYNYKSYTKMVIRDLSKPDTVKMMAITETQAESFWEKPDNYKEIITARRQSANIDGADNLVSIGELLNFNKNRIEIEDYAVVSPVAEDALDYYNYYLYDSTYIDNRKVYKLEAEPRNQADALVEGFIFIADSTFDVVDVDLGFNEGVRLPFVKNLRYRQRVAQFENQYWMPIELSFTAVIEIKFPMIPDKMGFELVASIHDYSFEDEHEQVDFDEYVIEVDEKADDIDSSSWELGQTLPLTFDELRGYHYLDSVEQAPKPLGKHAARVGLAALYLMTIGEYDLLRYNRVEGPYVGLALGAGASNRGLRLSCKSGYAFEAELYEYSFGARYQFPGKAKLALSGNYHRQVNQQWNINQSHYNSSFEALFFKYDPVYYFYERGFEAEVEMSPLRHFTAGLGVEAVRHRSLRNNTDYSVFNQEEKNLANFQISDGDLRAINSTIEYDSRSLWRNKGRDFKLDATQYSTFRITGEVSSPDIFSSDFGYKRLYAKFFRRQRLLGMGITSINLFGGISDGTLPRQKWFAFADYSGFVAGDQASFMNLGDVRFAGDRAACVFVNHDFGQYLFKKSGVPLIKSIPFTLSVYGGAFWSSFKKQTPELENEYFKTAEKPYTEAGFAVGNLTPFLSLFNFAVYLSWQLSDYDVGNFVTRVGIKF